MLNNINLYTVDAIWGDLMEKTELLQGSYDLHIHLGPDVMPRKLEDLEMAARAGARLIAANCEDFAQKDEDLKIATQKFRV